MNREVERLKKKQSKRICIIVVLLGFAVTSFLSMDTYAEILENIGSVDSEIENDVAVATLDMDEEHAQVRVTTCAATIIDLNTGISRDIVDETNSLVKIDFTTVTTSAATVVDVNNQELMEEAQDEPIAETQELQDETLSEAVVEEIVIVEEVVEAAQVIEVFSKTSACGTGFVFQPLYAKFTFLDEKYDLDSVGKIYYEWYRYDSLELDEKQLIIGGYNENEYVPDIKDVDKCISLVISVRNESGEIVGKAVESVERFINGM